ncbi:MAG: hypothetical protein JWN52_7448 [Actinomycetia bacterium]|nr:hypothetical protein [Actinomycetes bacterium]
MKTGTDADVGLIDLQSPTRATIGSLTSLSAPGSLPTSTRIQPTETTVFQVRATLTQYRLEGDSDYHLLLADGSGHSMITEIPDPRCVGSSSPLLSHIRKARSKFDARYTPNRHFQTANVPVTITGIGFFDFLHGQRGVAPNGIELHAVLDVHFGTGRRRKCHGHRPRLPRPKGRGTPRARGLLLHESGGVTVVGPTLNCSRHH